MTVQEITSLDMPELDVYARLTEIQLRSRVDSSKGIFIAETNTVVDLALRSGHEPLSFLMERKYITGQAAEILARYPQVPVYTGDREVLAGLTGYKLTRGILAAFRRKPLTPVEQVLSTAKRIAVLDGIVDATNVGAIVRSAAGLDMDAILFTPDCSDPLCRRSVRVSMGTIFQIPWSRLPDYNLLKEAGFATVAMALKDDSVALDSPELKGEKKIALILGSEGYGLPRERIAACDYTVKIPMGHDVDSLNVAAASAIAFWEINKDK